ncbi:S-adenosylmethionine decarboxylase proenzyme 4 [Oryza brachyantha]|uniref:S-adenosylmethionine decarboxylase proenzyme 4 n=1 Tax=Oryza brachyantha TaxID=4533 RepID=UPI001ADA4217|nr:S-adenosylmethionine decarboxylase proenzyme 4 [Oryza brachyantha]
MASSGFEGFEKRLELVFTLPVGGGGVQHGLRLMPVEALREVLDEAQCTVVSAAGNAAFDAYVLSESSLFVYPGRVVLKTCGTTRLLRAVPVLLRTAAELGGGLALRSCRYSRGEYLFPEAQPFPHADFADEVGYLDGAVPGELRFRRSAVLPPPSSSCGAASRRWHVYSASSSCFYQRPGDGRTSHAIGDEMTAASGIAGVNPRSLVCAYAFAPCGYSMNSLDGARYATIHVTPEDGHSYASYECTSDDTADALASVRRAVAAFRPATVSVSVSYTGGATSPCTAVAEALEPLGLSCESHAAEEFPGAGTVTYQTFTVAASTMHEHDK